MKKLTTLVGIITLVACTTDRKVCDFTSQDEQLLIYNHILTDLIENHMYRSYLGARGDQIREKYLFNSNPDTVRYDLEMTRAHNEIFQKPSEFCTLYLDTLARTMFYYDSVEFGKDFEFKSMITEYTEDPRAAIDSLNAIQNRYSPEDFNLCIAHIGDIRTWRTDSACVIGVLRLSKLVLNEARTKGLLFYDWHCGGLCGHRGIIQFVKLERWQIKDFKYSAIY